MDFLETILKQHYSLPLPEPLVYQKTPSTQHSGGLHENKMVLVSKKF